MPKDDKTDPTASDGSVDAELDHCAHCGERLPNDQWCPTVTETAADGTRIFRSFCDDDCLDAWATAETDENADE